MNMEHFSMSMFVSKKAREDALAGAAVKEIREICGLLYDGYGEDIHPTEQLDMIRGVLSQYERNK